MRKTWRQEQAWETSHK